MAEVEVLLDAKADVGEGPVWLGGGHLLWVDITRGQIHILDVTTGRDRIVVTLPEMVGAAVPRRSGGFVAATESGFVAIEADGTWSSFAEVESSVPGNRMNDGACDPQGRLWAGTMAFDVTPGAGALYRLDGDGAVSKQLQGTSLANGLGWSPDATVMYFTDSALGAVDRFDFDSDTGAISNRERLIDVEVETRGSIPDGLTVDADGGLWIAIWGDGRVQRYSPDGQPDAAIRFPASQITSCAFGGEQMRTLFVTSAAYRLDDERLAHEPLAGAVFAVATDVVGLRAEPFADQ